MLLIHSSNLAFQSGFMSITPGWQHVIGVLTAKQKKKNQRAPTGMQSPVSVDLSTICETV